VAFESLCHGQGNLALPRGVEKDMRATLDRGFEEFVRARSASLLRTAVLLAGGGQDAQDLLQQALWRTHRRWGQAIEHPDAYVRRVLVNLAHDGRRRASRRVSETSYDGVTGPSFADSSLAVIERDALVRGLRALPARQRAALVLRFWDDLSVDETAAALGCTAGTVKSTTSKGLARLREVLAGTDAESELTP
jgi:RNA polymerase sigma-70 factor (sigma-E family)